MDAGPFVRPSRPRMWFPKWWLKSGRNFGHQTEHPQWVLILVPRNVPRKWARFRALFWDSNAGERVPEMSPCAEAPGTVREPREVPTSTGSHDDPAGSREVREAQSGLREHRGTPGTIPQSPRRPPESSRTPETLQQTAREHRGGPMGCMEDGELRGSLMGELSVPQTLKEALKAPWSSQVRSVGPSRALLIQATWSRPRRSFPAGPRKPCGGTCEDLAYFKKVFVGNLRGGRRRE